jgi:hypothetical protein
MTTVNGHHPLGEAINGTGMNGIIMNGTTPPPSDDQSKLLSQRADLEREVEAVRSELAAARARVAERDAALKAALREELMTSRERLAAMEADHAEQLAAIRAETQASVERIIADAQRQIGELS